MATFPLPPEVTMRHVAVGSVRNAMTGGTGALAAAVQLVPRLTAEQVTELVGLLSWLAGVFGNRLSEGTAEGQMAVEDLFAGLVDLDPAVATLHLPKDGDTDDA